MLAGETRRAAEIRMEIAGEPPMTARQDLIDRWPRVPGNGAAARIRGGASWSSNPANACAVPPC